MLKKIFRPIFSLVIGSGILSLGLMWAAAIVAYLLLLPFSSYVGPSPALLSWVGATAGLALVGIPIFSLMMYLTRWFSSYRLPSNIKVPMRITWFASLMICGYMAFEIGTDYSEESTLTSEAAYNIYDDEIHLASNNDKDLASVKVVRFLHTQYSKKGLVNRNVDITIRKATDSKVTIEQVVKAYGGSENAATKRAEQITANYTVTANTINIPEYFFVDKSQKLRDQSIDYIIHIPEGKKLTFDNYFDIKNESAFEESCRCDKSKYTWTMGPDGLYSQEWRDKYRATKQIDLPTLTNINLEGDFDIVLKQGQESKALLQGRSDDFERIDYIATEGTVSFIKNKYFTGNPVLQITVPTFATVNAKDVERLSIEGFKQDKMEIIYHSGGDLKAYVDVEHMKCEMVGRATGTFIGSGKLLDIKLDRAKIDAQKYITEITNVSGINSYGPSTIYASKEANYDEAIAHSLEIFGDPKMQEQE